MRRALFLCALLASFSLGALEVPPPPTQWVTDRAGLLGGTETDLLNRKLSDFEQETGAQFIVYIFPSLEGESMEDFTIRAVERWKVGQKKYDNGLVLFVFAQEQRVRVEVGYGLEGTITDAVSSRVIREQIAPAFQQKRYYDGLNAAANELMTRIRKGEAPVDPLNPRSGQGQPQRARGEDIGIVPLLFILFIVFFVLAPMFAGGRRGRGGCGGCIFPFFFPGGGITFGGGGYSSGGFGGGFGGGGFGGGGFSGGGGGFGGGGASGGW